MDNSSKPHGAVTCESQFASSIGAQILQEGGSAADAIIAATLAVGTIASYHSGIGGGGFAIVRQPDGYHRSLDFRPAAPACIATILSMFAGKPEATGVGGLSVAVPGELRGFEELHKSYGKLPWKRLFEPSIELARDGFPFTEDLAHMIRSKTILKDTTTDSSYRDLSHSWILNHPILREMYAKDGVFLPVGANLTRPKLAHALEFIAEKGADAFYEGQLAKDLVDAVAAEGGVMTLDDLKNYKVRETKPLSIDYKGKFKVISPSAPASGGVLLLALNILSNQSNIGGPGSVEDSHMLIESLKFAYAHRTLLGDPGFIPGLEDVQDEFMKPEVGRDLYSKILKHRTLPSEMYNTDRLNTVIKPDHGTSNIVAVDSDGLVISITTTITLWWGSRIVVPSSDIVLNGSIEDFSVEGQSNHFGYLPTSANYIRGNKRPLSSSSPFIIEDSAGRFRYAGGAAGGSRIISCNVQQARNFMDYGMNASQALAHHRLHDQITPNETHLEIGLVDNGIAATLEQMGHKIKWLPRAESVGCAVSYDPDTGLFQAEGEPRLVGSGGRVV
ncbi:gamma-glutamyltranspeptidase [Lentinula detonsa]|uniref:Glutathione hydrolase n=1 Tax=Lentinula detonsa TaxID=2804962 RepID=A0A9W8TWN6_9AGAR|nr:gamma-glutamyltranspeptidase [Lentinula detonsa]KAJ3985063.1 gamma-glutamyltranspeptidase [Lentinula detonsa]